MASSYPGTIDSFTTKTDNTDDVMAAHVNDLQNAVVSIQTELGTDPAGSLTDVKTRLAVSLNNDGSLKSGLTPTFGDTVIADGSGLLIGSASRQTIVGNAIEVQMLGTATADTRAAIVRYSADANGPIFYLGKSRNAAIGSFTVVQDGDDLGSVAFIGDDGSDLTSTAAEIRAEVDGTPGSNDMPGRLVFLTTQDGAQSVTEALRLDASQNATFAGDLAVNGGDITSSAATASLFNTTPTTINIGGGATQLTGTTTGWGIGTPSPGATLDVRGNAVFNEDGGDYDFRVESDANTNMIFVDASANNIGLGTTPDSDNFLKTMASKTDPTASNYHEFNTFIKNTSENATLQRGAYFYSAYSSTSSADHTGEIIAIEGAAYNNNSGQNIATVKGLSFATGVLTSGTITNALNATVGFYTTGGTITNGYDVYISDASGGGTITNHYGLYIEDINSGATTNYAIYSAGGQSYFAGNVGIGISSSLDGKVHIDQSSTTGAIPVLTLDQADVSEQFIKLIGESAADNSQSLADAADLTTPGAVVGWIRVQIEDVAAAGAITDGDYWVPFYATPTA